MRFWDRVRRGPSRRPRAFQPVADHDAGLETRVLLSQLVVIRWSMAPMIRRDPAHGNQPDLPNTPAYVNPPDGYVVQLNASNCVGILPRTTFAWIVTNPGGQTVASADGEYPDVKLQTGSYTLTLVATGLRGTSGPVTAVKLIAVKDLLIVSIGDSYASGEGNPVVPGVLYPQWAYSPDPAMELENADAHRSTIAASAKFALRLQQSHPQEAVTFVSVADSGATIPEGLLGPMPSIGDPSHELPAQIPELQSIIGTRHIDVLTVSIGGNDAGFKGIIINLAKNTYIGSPTLAEIKAQFTLNLQILSRSYGQLAQSIDGLDPGRVLMTGYPDLTRNELGVPATIRGPLGLRLISQTNAAFASKQILPPLDAAVADAAHTYGWSLVSGFYRAFLKHGYPSTSSWFVRLGESLVTEGSVNGAFHPNAAGQRAIAGALLETYLDH
jgi:lysophospholipase L1-like esterase